MYFLILTDVSTYSILLQLVVSYLRVNYQKRMELYYDNIFIRSR